MNPANMQIWRRVAGAASLTFLLFGCGGGDTQDAAKDTGGELQAAIEPAAAPADLKLAEPLGEKAAALASTVTLPARFTSFFIPPHTNGDAEFEGHGPDVDFNAQLFVANGNQLWLMVHMRAIETRSDWTTAEGTRYYQIATLSGQISGILSGTTMTHRYRDSNHGRDVFSFAPGDLAERLEYVGDTRGNEAGSRTGVQVFLQPITVALR
jgi:hypothetical protein